MQLSVLPDPKTGTPTIFLPQLANIHALCNEETQHQGEEEKAAEYKPCWAAQLQIKPITYSHNSHRIYNQLLLLFLIFIF